MLLLLLGLESIAFFDHVEIRYAPVVGKMNFLAPANDVCRRKKGTFNDWFQMNAVPAYMVRFLVRLQDYVQKFLRC
jgi:hypothetical protein